MILCKGQTILPAVTSYKGICLVQKLDYEKKNGILFMQLQKHNSTLTFKGIEN